MRTLSCFYNLNVDYDTVLFADKNVNPLLPLQPPRCDNDRVPRMEINYIHPLSLQPPTCDNNRIASTDISNNPIK